MATDFDNGDRYVDFDDLCDHQPDGAMVDFMAASSDDE